MFYEIKSIRKMGSWEKEGYPIITTVEMIFSNREGEEILGVIELRYFGGSFGLLIKELSFKDSRTDEKIENPPEWAKKIRVNEIQEILPKKFPNEFGLEILDFHLENLYPERVLKKIFGWT